MAFPSDHNLALWESRELSHLQPWAVKFLITINSYFTALALEISCHVCVYCIKSKLLSHTHQLSFVEYLGRIRNINVIALFSEQFVLKNSKPVHSGHCQEMCEKIAPGVVYFLDDSLKCRCNFCRKHITNLFVSSQKMAYFLNYTGFDDIFSLRFHTLLMELCIADLFSTIVIFCQLCNKIGLNIYHFVS